MKHLICTAVALIALPFCAAIAAACDAEGLVLGAGQMRRPPAGADRALHHLEPVTIDARIAGELPEILR